MKVILALVLMTTTAMADTASWYGPGFNGRKTASGERFNENAMTCAHKTLPFGTHVEVTYKGRKVVCRVNDRGPYVRDRKIDLSKAVARALGITGTANVQLRVLK